MSFESDDALPSAEFSSQHRGVRVWSVQAPTQQELIDRISVLLGEHMDDGDELHMTHSVVQNGSRDYTRNRPLGPPKTWTELSFEHTALIVLRAPRSA